MLTSKGEDWNKKGFAQSPWTDQRHTYKSQPPPSKSRDRDKTHMQTVDNQR